MRLQVGQRVEQAMLLRMGIEVKLSEITLTDAERTGYTFLGWTGNGTTTPTKNLKLPKNSSGDKTFTANWEIINYPISYSDEELADGKQYETCPLDMSRFEGAKKRTMINVYPNPAVANSEITVEITQNYIPEAEKSITIYSLGGTLVQRISSPEQLNTIRLQGGIYSVVYAQNGEQVVFKLIVH